MLNISLDFVFYNLNSPNLHFQKYMIRVDENEIRF